MIYLLLLGAVLIILGILTVMGKLNAMATFGIPKSTLEKLDLEKYIRYDGIITIVTGILFLVAWLLWNAGQYTLAKGSVLGAVAVVVIGIIALIRGCRKK